MYYNVYYSAFRFTSIPPAAESRYRTPPALTPANESSYRTISYGGTSPWNSTGFAYTPRYPQSYRGITFLLKMLISLSKIYLWMWEIMNLSLYYVCLITGTASTSVPYARRYSYDDMYLLEPPYYKYVPFYMYYR